MMLSGLLLLVTSPAALAVEEPGLVVYHCTNRQDQSQFTLTYLLSGSRISEVAIGHSNGPRLGSDVTTRWRGKLVGDNVEFLFGEKSRGYFLNGTMRLALADVPGRYLLTWSTVEGGGHVVFESETRSADCVIPDFTKPKSATQ